MCSSSFIFLINRKSFRKPLHKYKFIIANSILKCFFALLLMSFFCWKFITLSITWIPNKKIEVNKSLHQTHQFVFYIHICIMFNTIIGFSNVTLACRQSNKTFRVFIWIWIVFTILTHHQQLVTSFHLIWLQHLYVDCRCAVYFIIYTYNQSLF